MARSRSRTRRRSTRARRPSIAKRRARRSRRRSHRRGRKTKMLMLDDNKSARSTTDDKGLPKNTLGTLIPAKVCSDSADDKKRCLPSLSELRRRMFPGTDGDYHPVDKE